MKSKVNLKVMIKLVIISIIFVQTSNSLCPSEPNCTCDPQTKCPKCQIQWAPPQSLMKRCPNSCNCMVRSHDRTLLLHCSNKNLQESPTLSNSMLHEFPFIEFNISYNSIKQLPIIELTGCVINIYAQHNSIKQISIENIPDQ